MKLTLKQWRAIKGLTQKQLSDITGISETTLSAWEKGHSSPTFKNLKIVCEALQIGIDDIIMPDS